MRGMKRGERNFIILYILKIYNIITIYLVRKQTKAVNRAKNNCITA
jgi:hypothetical protein